MKKTVFYFYNYKIKSIFGLIIKPPKFMKNSLIKIYLLAFFLVGDFYAFAQPGTDNDGGDLEGEDPETPINAKLIYLAIAGIAFAFYSFTKRRQEKAAN